MHTPPDVLYSNTTVVGNPGAYATIQAAITAASAGELVYVMPGTYTEALTMKAGVDVFGPMADVVGTIAGAACSVKIRDYTGAVTSAADFDLDVRDHTIATGVIGCTFAVAGRSVYTARDVTCAGTGIGVLSTHASGELTYTADHVSVATGFAAGNLSGISGHLHYTAKTIEFTGAGSGIVVAGDGHVVGSVDTFEGAAGTAINVLVDAGKVQMTVREINTTAAWTTVTGGEIELDGPVNIIAGTQTGTAKVNGRYILQSGDVIATDVPADGSVLPVAVGNKLWDGNNQREYTARTAASATRWCGEERQLPVEYDGNITSTNPRTLPCNPRGTDLLWVIEAGGRWDQTQAVPANNYFDFSLEFDGGVLGTWSSAGVTEDVWANGVTSIDTLIDFTDLDGEGDISGADGFRVNISETGTQVMFLSQVVTVCEVFE